MAFTIFYSEPLDASFSFSEGTTSASVGVEWTELDQEALGFKKPKLKHQYDPSIFTFVLSAANHLKPIGDRATIIVYDDDFQGGDLTRPVFEGHVWDIKPGTDANEIEYTCYDQTMRARQEITIMSGPHANPSVIPRLVYNSKIDNDDDRAFEYRHDATVGDIIVDLLSFAYNELTSNCEAAPPPTSGGPAYVLGDLSAFDFEPQEKVVFESEKLGQGLDRLMQHYPQYRIWFEPGLHSTGRKWRFKNVKSAPTVTLTLNDFTGTYKVHSLSLSRSFEGRATAIKIYGPPVAVFDIVYWNNEHEVDNLSAISSTSILGGGLTAVWSNQHAANFREFGPFGRPEAIGYAGRRWQITDETKRRLAKILPAETIIPIDEFNFLGTELLQKRTRQPTFQVTFNDGRDWIPCNGAILDYLNGVITLPYHAWQGANFGQDSSSIIVQPSSGDDIGLYRLPDNARFYFAYYDYAQALYVRSPVSGYDGTAWEVANMRVEEKLYDEMLAIGYEAGGTVVTSEARKAQYQKLADAMAIPKKDIIYTGGCVLEGIQYGFWGLGKRISIAAIDSQGNPIVTGWENIGAILTDVEWDYEGTGSTTLTWASDQMEFTQQDPERLKAELKIRAQEIVEQININIGVGQKLFNVRRFIVEHGPNGQNVVGEL